MKVIKQVGKPNAEEIDLEWANDNAQKSYDLLFGYLDVIKEKNPDLEKCVDGAKNCANTMVNMIKLAVLLSDPDEVLKTVFYEFPVEIFEKDDEES